MLSCKQNSPRSEKQEGVSSQFGQKRLLSIPLFTLWLCFRTSIDIDRYFCFLQ